MKAVKASKRPNTKRLQVDWLICCVMTAAGCLTYSKWHSSCCWDASVVVACIHCLRHIFREKEVEQVHNSCMRSTREWKRCVVQRINTVISSEGQVITFLDMYPRLRLMRADTFLKADNISQLVARRIVCVGASMWKAGALVDTIYRQRSIDCANMLVIICPIQRS